MGCQSYLDSHIALHFRFSIAGFTAWSSTREPFQVFSLLETVYADFDKIAKRRGVFKVEVRVPHTKTWRLSFASMHACILSFNFFFARRCQTIGDCYVAVTGKNL